MALAIIYINYESTEEGKKLFRLKDPFLFNKNIKEVRFINLFFKEIINLSFLIIRDKEDILLFLDSPYIFKNILMSGLYLIKRILRRNSKTFIPYISIRGAIPLKGSKKYLLKIFIWKSLNFLSKFLNFKFIASSAYEAKEIRKILRYSKTNLIIVKPDIVFHKDYFEAIDMKIDKFLESTSFPKIKKEDKKSRKVKILVPSRTSQEKGVNELVKLINQDYLNIDQKKTIYQFDFCCEKKDLYIYPNLKNKFIETNFLGWLEIYKFLKNLSKYDLIIIPSLYESFSIAAYQALLFKKPIIITKNSPWEYISYKNPDLPIKTCSPLLKNYNLEKLINLIDNTHHLNTNKLSRKFIQECIKNESKSFHN